MKLDAWGGPSTDDLATGDEYDAEALRQYAEQGPLFSWYEDTGGYTYAHENPRAWALLSSAEVEALSQLVAIAKYSDDQPRDENGRWTSGGGNDGNAIVPIDHTPDRDSPEWDEAVADIESQGMGNCFEAAVTLADPGANLGLKNARIVQGTVMGQGKLAGVRFVHTWVEADSTTLRDEDGNEYTFRDAYDYASGNRVVMADSLYRHLGQVEDVTEYTWDEAVEQMLSKGHYGPWDPKLEGHI